MASHDTTSRYSKTLGIALLEALASDGRFIFSTEDAREAAARVDLAPGAVDGTLRRLTNAGWVERVRRGLYATTGELPGLGTLHPFALATALVQPSSISHWSALSFHGLTTQIPRLVTCMTTRRVVMPSMRHQRPDATRDRHLWETAGGLRASYVLVTPARYFGIEEVWVDQRSRVPITDRERTVLETFAHPAAFGGLGEGLAILEEHVGDLDLERLVAHALRYGATSVAKRLGFSLARLGASDAVLVPLRELPMKGVRRLDPSRPGVGRCDATWGIQENLAR